MRKYHAIYQNETAVASSFSLGREKWNFISQISFKQMEIEKNISNFEILNWINLY